MPSSTEHSPVDRRWRWWIPDYPERLGARDVIQIVSTVLLTVVFTIAAIARWTAGGVLPLLAALAAVLGAVGLVGIAIGLRRARRDGP